MLIRILAVKQVLKSAGCLFCNDELNRNNSTVGALKRLVLKNIVTLHVQGKKGNIGGNGMQGPPGPAVSSKFMCLILSDTH